MKTHGCSVSFVGSGYNVHADSAILILRGRLGALEMDKPQC